MTNDTTENSTTETETLELLEEVKRQARAKKTLSIATKIITRHRLGHKTYSPQKLKWAFKIFGRQGGKARVKSMSKKEHHDLAMKAAAASAKERKKRARLLDLVEERLGSESFEELEKLVEAEE